MDKLRILIIEDDKLAQAVMGKHLADNLLDFASDMHTAEKLLKTGKHDICFVDLKLGKDDDYSGLKLLPLAKKLGVYPVVMSSSDDEETINKAYALGCRDFYVKGNEAQNIGAVLAKYKRHSSPEMLDDIFSSQLITNDNAMRAMITEALKYSATDIPIMLLGPSGTGKTRIARVIHEHSGRQGEFVAINCSAYSEDLLEAELFGYKKGAFTGAYDNRKGKLALANNGTLFLDEIGSMSQNMQTKLLKAIEEKTFYPVGSDKAEHSSFRIISATLEDVQQLIAKSKMRFDFFQRIHGFTLTLKPLCQRKDDIFPLIADFSKGGKRLSFEQDAKTFLLNYNWPGNIRELKKFVEMVSAGDGLVRLEMVQNHIASRVKMEVPAGSVADGMLTNQQYDCAMTKGLNETLDHFAWEIIKRNLSENNGKKARTLEQLKISTRLLYSTLKKFGGK